MSLKFSNSHLWANCVAACSPEGHTPARADEFGDGDDGQLEGQAAHWVAKWFIDARVPEDLPPAAPNGWPIDRLMILHGKEYAGLVCTHGMPRAEIEASLFGGLVNGRIDAETTEAVSTLHLYEYKYGHRIVEVHDNTQLLLGAGALFDDTKHSMIMLHVFQPRAYHPDGPHRKWAISPAEFLDHMDILREAAEATKNRMLPATCGRWCELCPRAGNCGTLTANIFAQYDLIRNRRQSREMTGPELAAYGRFLEAAHILLEAARKANKAELEARMRTDWLPGWEVTPTQAQTDWAEPLALREAALGMKLTKAVELSPNQAIEAGADRAKVERMTQKLSKGFKMVASDNKKILRRMEKWGH